MIEELKLVLDSIGDLTGVALWVVGFFIVFKLVVYLSTTGAVVYILKLLIMKTHSILTSERKVKKEWVHLGKYYPDETKAILDDIYNQVFSCDTHYTTEARELQKAWYEYKNKGK